MEIPILIENLGDHYRAWCRKPVNVEATGLTSYDARLAVEEKLRAALGVEVETLPLDANEPGKSWLAFAGTLPDDELTAEWLAAIAARRHTRNAADTAAVL